MENYKGRPINFNDIQKAGDRIASGIIHTPLCEAKSTKFLDYNLYLKCENLQYTGSACERGIRNAFLVNHEEIKASGAIVPSHGSSALAAAYQANLLGLPVTVVLPDGTSPSTAQRCSEHGADVIIVGDSRDDAVVYTEKVAPETKQLYIKPDDPLMMAGLGTVGEEVLSQLPGADAVLVPVRSGALLAGVLVACKKIKCTCLVYGVECSKMPKMMKALQAGQPVAVPHAPGVAPGLDAVCVGENAFATIKGRLDRMLLVDDVWISRALVHLLEQERLVADASGVCAMAAVMQGLVPELKGKKAVCILSSSSADAARLTRLIQRGLGASGRLLRFSVALPDASGGLRPLAAAIAEENAVLKSLVTEQTWVLDDVAVTWAVVIVETANDQHAANFKDKIREMFPSAKFSISEYEKHQMQFKGN